MKMASMFKLHQDLFSNGASVMTHGKHQIIPQTTLFNQFLKLLMLWKISLSWNSAEFRETKGRRREMVGFWYCFMHSWHWKRWCKARVNGQCLNDEIHASSQRKWTWSYVDNANCWWSLQRLLPRPESNVNNHVDQVHKGTQTWGI